MFLLMNNRVIFPYRTTSDSTRARIVCFPFAGGSASVFREWGALLSPLLEVCAVELPGHGQRMAEKCGERADTILEEVSAGLRALPSLPTFVYGHSMGALLAFELARRMEWVSGLIVSGSHAPYSRPADKYKDMSESALVEQLRSFGGTPPAVFDDPMMLDLFLPPFRADLRVASSIDAQADDNVMCPLTVLAAVDDPEVPLRDAEAWSVHATGPFRFVRQDGGHFFLITRRAAVLSEIAQAVELSLAKGSTAAAART
ncbi:MAG: thioesterase [Myxococcaceae bacterium]|nr:thioesterase [Myxococcaceae bacterium]